MRSAYRVSPRKPHVSAPEVGLTILEQRKGDRVFTRFKRFGTTGAARTCRPMRHDACGHSMCRRAHLSRGKQLVFAKKPIFCLQAGRSVAYHCGVDVPDAAVTGRHPPSECVIEGGMLCHHPACGGPATIHVSCFHLICVFGRLSSWSLIFAGNALMESELLPGRHAALKVGAVAGFRESSAFSERFFSIGPLA